MTTFSSPKLTVVTVNGKKYLFAAQSFIDEFPELINQVFCVPDIEFGGNHFDRYCEDRVRCFETCKEEYSEHVTDSALRAYAADLHSLEIKQGGKK